MERKSFLGLVIGALLGLVILFVVYSYFFKDNQSGGTIRDTAGDFFPIGGDIPEPTGNGGAEEPGINTDTPPQAVVIPKLRLISRSPVAGYIAFDRGTSTKIMTGTSTFRLASTTEMVVRYIEKSTGHIHEANENTLDVNRISNTTLGIFDKATFSNSSSFVAQKFNPETTLIDTYIGSMVRAGTSTNEFRTTGTYYPRNPETVAVRGTSIFSLYSYALNSEGYTTQTAPVRETKVFSSPLSGWNVEWINRDTLLLTTKPHSGYDGYVYSYNPTTKRMAELLTTKPGLTAKVNATLTAGLYSESYNDQLFFYMNNFSKDTYFQLPKASLPEKCVFSIKDPMIAYCAIPQSLPEGSYPEDWYKGKVQFDDALVKIDLERNVQTPLVNLAEEGGVAIDAVNLSFNEKETHLVFQNKRDGYVWSYDLR